MDTMWKVDTNADVKVNIDAQSEWAFKERECLTWTSSSFLIGILRTLYFWRKSLERGVVMIFLLTWDGALKCRFLFFLREEDTILLNFMILQMHKNHSLSTTLRQVCIPGRGSALIQTPLPGSRPPTQAEPHVMWPVMHAGMRQTPTNRMTHAFENITLFILFSNVWKCYDGHIPVLQGGKLC